MKLITSSVSIIQLTQLSETQSIISLSLAPLDMTEYVIIHSNLKYDQPRRQKPGDQSTAWNQISLQK